MYLHPSVTSQIIDESSTYVTSEGVTQLFAVITADKGEDNQIVKVSTSSEFIFKFGAPNMKKHGQAAYNIVNWLDQNGGAYVIRVLPEDAGFAHAFLNIQTKEDVKLVADSENQLVEYPDVLVRSTVSYTQANNTSTDAIKRELTAPKTKTIDGYDNHLLLAIYPKGRGSYYNNLGFRLSLTTAYDETYSFRLYNLEVTQVGENGSIQVIEGPFLVSFDPDAVSAGNESLFIESVLSNNSDYFNVKFNETALDELGTIINPNVNPGYLDILTGTTPTIDDAPQTYYDSTLGMDVDVQIRTHHYNANGEYSGKSNYNMKEDNIIAIDNSNRNSFYLDGLLLFNNSKIVLSRFKKNTYDTLLAEVVVLEDQEASGGSKNELVGGALNVAYTNQTTAVSGYNTAKDSYIASKTEENFNILNASIKQTLEAIKTTCKTIKTVISYTEPVVDQSILSTEIKSKLNSVTNQLDILNIITLGSYNQQQSLFERYTALAALNGKSNAEKLSTCFDTLNIFDEVINYIAELDKTGVLGADQEYTKIVELYNACLTDYNEATDPYLLEGEDVPLIAKLISDCSSLLNAVQNTLSLVEAENNIVVIADVTLILNEIKNSICSLSALALSAVKNASTVEAKEDMIKYIKSVIDEYEIDLVDLKINAYIIKLQDYIQPIFLKQGHNGSLDNVSTTVKSSLIASLMIKAFKGYIDANLTDKALYPIDVILDANYPSSVKNAIIECLTNTRDDIMGILDTQLPNTPVDSVNYKAGFITNAGFNIAVFTQYFTIADTQYTGKDIDVTPTYYLASKIPANDSANGVHSTFVGPRRGLIDETSFKKLSFNPTDAWKEQFYKNKINYIEKDSRRTKFATQLTFQKNISALSQISNVRALLKIRKEAEAIAQEYIYERMTDDTLQLLDQELNEYLIQWQDNGCCKSIVGKVYATDYEKSQGTLNVLIELVFTDIIERININLLVTKENA